MKKVTIIGTSHVAALRSGWDKIVQDFPDVDVSFFAAGGKCIQEAQLDAKLRFGLLKATTNYEAGWQNIENIFGKRNIDLSTSDAVIYVGINIYEGVNIALLNKFSIDGFSPVPGRPRLSGSAYSAICVSLAERAFQDSIFTAHRIANLYILSIPRPSEHVLASSDANDQRWVELLNGPKPVPKALSEFYHHAAKVFSKHGARLIEPPEQVLNEFGVTSSVFCRDAPSFVEGRNHTDYRHMNAQYGAIVLDHILSEITNRTTPAKATSPKKRTVTK